MEVLYKCMAKRGAEAFQCGGAGKLIIPGKTPTVAAIAVQNENGYFEVICPKSGGPVVASKERGDSERRRCKINGKPCPYDTRPY